MAGAFDTDKSVEIRNLQMMIVSNFFHYQYDCSRTDIGILSTSYEILGGSVLNRKNSILIDKNSIFEKAITLFIQLNFLIINIHCTFYLVRQPELFFFLIFYNPNVL